jgi:hypothetical protein
MIEVTIRDIMPNEAMDIVKELRKMGHIQGVHFDFEYHKPEILVDDYAAVYNRYTIFKFYKEELATWFSLRYL